MANDIPVANLDELRPGECKVVRAGARQVALFNVNGEFFATENACPHRGGPLGDGSLEGEFVTCPWHDWQFNVRTGGHNGSTAGIQTFQTEILNDLIWLKG